MHRCANSVLSRSSLYSPFTPPQQGKWFAAVCRFISIVLIYQWPWSSEYLWLYHLPGSLNDWRVEPNLNPCSFPVCMKIRIFAFCGNFYLKLKSCSPGYLDRAQSHWKGWEGKKSDSLKKMIDKTWGLNGYCEWFPTHHRGLLCLSLMMLTEFTHLQ